MTSPGPRRDGLVCALAQLRGVARQQAADVLAHVPDTGDPTTGRAVDDFVEHAGDALLALDEAVSRALSRLDAAEDARGGDAYPPSRPAERS